MKFSRFLIPALLALVFTTGTANAVCPLGQFYLDLKSGATAPLAGVTTIFSGPATVTPKCPAAAGWKRALVKIDIPTGLGCTQANVVVEYQGLPSAWTLDLADTSINDGYGGGFTPYNAEVQIVDNTLRVYNAATTGTEVDNILTQQLALENGALKLAVQNQSLSIGNPTTVLATPRLKRLFGITAPDNSPDGGSLWLGLNQVVSFRADRVGCGARRVLITFQ